MGNEKHDLMAANLLRGNTGILVLAILRTGAAHGYAIASEIAKRSENALSFKQGTLYPLLHELERDGFITSEWQIVEGERPRRVYTLTESGSKELSERLELWNSFNQAMTQVIGGTPDEQT
ncbi:MAG: helix-turn-helix transcriptional regulator [Fimbriimonadaceae bacterium]|jgi:DNA-binding PadR family transcriptional regulator|nr:helix-turn-helix transcriptional regulator [Fimbriimonadaceae bacterium]